MQTYARERCRNLIPVGIKVLLVVRMQHLLQHALDILRVLASLEALVGLQCGFAEMGGEVPVEPRSGYLIQDLASWAWGMRNHGRTVLLVVIVAAAVPSETVVAVVVRWVCEMV